MIIKELVWRKNNNKQSNRGGNPMGGSTGLSRGNTTQSKSAQKENSMILGEEIVPNSNSNLERNQHTKEGNFSSRFRALAGLDLNMEVGEEDIPEDFQSLNEEHFLDNFESNKDNNKRSSVLMSPMHGPTVEIFL